MGNENSNLNLHYHSKHRSQSIIVENLDYFRYPQMPDSENVETELNEILSELILDPEKEQLLRQQTTEIKWKVICRHKQALEQKIETKSQIERTPAQIFIEKVHDNPSIMNLEDLRLWLEEKTKEDDINSFLAFDGLKLLLETLENAEVNARITKNYDKQIVILKTLENLVNSDNQFIENLLKMEDSCKIIVMNFAEGFPELSNSVLEIFNTICWSENTEGHRKVNNAFNHLKVMRKFRYPFQPFVELLQNEKNIVLIENTIAFINTLIESSVDEEERRNIRFQFISCNLKQIYEKIKEKIVNDKYYIDDCVFQINEDSTKTDLTLMNKIILLGKTVYIERDQDEFEKHFYQVINQIEVFEKSAEEPSSLVDIDRESININTGRRVTKDKLDYTNINSIFEKLKNDSMTNDTFAYFLEILNYMILIPRNSSGQIIWEKMAAIFAEASEIQTDDWNDKVKELRSLAKETRNIEDLEENNSNLLNILASREEEINKLISEKNKYQMDLSKMSKDAEEIIKKYQQIELKLDETLKQKDLELIEKTQEISNLKKLIQEKDSNDMKKTQIKFESKISDLEKKLSAKEDEIKNLESQKNLKETSIPPAPNLNLQQQSPQTSVFIPPPPPNLFGNPNNLLIGQSIPPPPNLFGNPPPLNNLLIGQSIPPPPPPSFLLGNQNNQSSLQSGPPPLANLLSGQFGPPPLANLLGQSGPPPLANLLGKSGPPPIGNLLGQCGPPPIGNLLGGPPPLNFLGKSGPPSFLPNMMPLINQTVQKIKEKKKPRIPLKGLMWTLVPSANIKETIWEEINDEKVDLDIDFLEKEFATKKSAVVLDPKKVETQSKVIKVSLLPAEKNKNMEIVLGKLKLSNSTIKDALNQMDEAVLTINNVESLLNIIPTEEEVRTVESFEGDLEYLGNPEKFSLEISKVSGYKERLLGIKFVKTYEDLVKELGSKVDKINLILSNIPKNKKFKQLVEEILAVGNYLNGTTARGGAYGFQLDALEKINDLKMTNFPKKNLLMYIIDRYEKKNNENVIEINEDLSDYELASKTPISQLQTDLGEIRKGAKIIVNAINKSAETDELGKVQAYFQSPNEKVTKILEDLEKKLKVCEQNYLNCCKYLCESPKDTPSDKLIEKIYKLWIACKNAKNTLMKEQEVIRKEKERQMKFSEKKTLKPGKTLTGIDSFKMGSAEEIVETLKNRRQTKMIYSEFMTNEENLKKKEENFKKNEENLKKVEKNAKKNESHPKITEENLKKTEENLKKTVESPKKPVSEIKTASEIIESPTKKTKENQSTITVFSEEKVKINEKDPKMSIIIGENQKVENIKNDSKNVSPQYKKAGIIKGLELEAPNRVSLGKVEIRMSIVDDKSKKLAPISENKIFTPKKTTFPTLPETKSSKAPDYLSILKKKPTSVNDKNSPEKSSNLDYLANILTDGAIKKKSVMDLPPLPPAKDKK